MSELKEIIGVIEAKNDTYNSIKINGDWIGNTYKPKIAFNIGDKVKVFYHEKGKFKNHEKIELIEKAKEVSQYQDNIPISILLSYSKDLAMATIQSGMQVEDFKKLMEDCIEAILHGKEEIQKRLK